LASQVEGTAKVSAGVDELDLILGGGFKKGGVFMVCGAPGSGKSCFATRFGFCGLLSKEPLLYITIDERPEDLVEQMKLLGYDLREYIEDRLMLLASPPADFILPKGLDPQELEAYSTEIRDLVRQINAERLILDPFEPLFLGLERGASYYALRRFIAGLRDLGTTNLFTSYGEREWWYAQHLVDGVLRLRATERTGGCTRRLVVAKYRPFHIQRGVLSFDLVPGRGIVVKDEEEPLSIRRTAK